MDIHTLKERIILSTVIGHDVKLTKKGNRYMGRCPFHMEKTPSFSVDNQKGFYYCFGCGANGDAITYLEQKHNMSFQDAVKHLAESIGMSTDFLFQKREEKHGLLELFEDVCSYFEAQLNEPCRKYLHDRHILPQTQSTFRIGFCPNTDELYRLLSKKFPAELIEESGIFLSSKKSRFHSRLIFPIRNEKGKVIGFGGRAMDENIQPKYLNSTENPLFIKKQILYGLYESNTHFKNKTKEQFLLVEGYLDVIQLFQHSYMAAAPLGTAVSVEQIQLLWRYAPKPIICFDGDTAGFNAQKRICELILPFISAQHSLYTVQLPSHSDPDSLVKESPLEFQEIIKKPSNLVDTLWQYLHPHQTRIDPEHIAAIQEKIDSLCKTITNYTLSKLYRSTLSHYLWKYFYQHKTPTKHDVTTVPLKNERTFQEVLLATVINHPIILDEVHDNLGRTFFSEKDLEELRIQILDMYHSNKDIEKNKYKEVFNFQKLEVLAPFMRLGTDLEKVKKGWIDIWEAFFCPSQALSSRDWQTLKRIKQTYVKGVNYGRT